MDTPDIKAFSHREEMKKRIKTLAWSLLWVLVAAGAEHVSKSIGLLDLPNINILGTSVDTSVVLGLLLAQVSKYARNLRG